MKKILPKLFIFLILFFGVGFIFEVSAISCPGGSCPDGFTYGADPNAPQATCAQRASEACANHQGGSTTPVPPSSGLKNCSENYTESCTCTSGGTGTHSCHKQGQNTTGQPGPSCPWGPGSSCGACSCTTTAPPPTTGGNGLPDGATSGCCSNTTQCVGWFGSVSTCTQGNGACASGLQCHGSSCTPTHQCTNTDCGVTNGCGQTCNGGCGAICGNNVCDNGETSASCPADCQATTPVVSGSGSCDGSSTNGCVGQNPGFIFAIGTDCLKCESTATTRCVRDFTTCPAGGYQSVPAVAPTGGIDPSTLPLINAIGGGTCDSSTATSPACVGKTFNSYTVLDATRGIATQCIPNGTSCTLTYVNTGTGVVVTTGNCPLGSADGCINQAPGYTFQTGGLWFVCSKNANGLCSRLTTTAPANNPNTDINNSNNANNSNGTILIGGDLSVDPTITEMLNNLVAAENSCVLSKTNGVPNTWCVDSNGQGSCIPPGTVCNSSSTSATNPTVVYATPLTTGNCPTNFSLDTTGHICVLSTPVPAGQPTNPPNLGCPAGTIFQSNGTTSVCISVNASIAPIASVVSTPVPTPHVNPTPTSTPQPTPSPTPPTVYATPNTNGSCPTNFSLDTTGHICIKNTPVPSGQPTNPPNLGCPAGTIFQFTTSAGEQCISVNGTIAPVGSVVSTPIPTPVPNTSTADLLNQLGKNTCVGLTLTLVQQANPGKPIDTNTCQPVNDLQLTQTQFDNMNLPSLVRTNDSGNVEIYLCDIQNNCSWQSLTLTDSTSQATLQRALLGNPANLDNVILQNLLSSTPLGDKNDRQIDPNDVAGLKTQISICEQSFDSPECKLTKETLSTITTALAANIDKNTQIQLILSQDKNLNLTPAQTDFLSSAIQSGSDPRAIASTYINAQANFKRLGTDTFPAILEALNDISKSINIPLRNLTGTNYNDPNIQPKRSITDNLTGIGAGFLDTIYVAGSFGDYNLADATKVSVDCGNSVKSNISQAPKKCTDAFFLAGLPPAFFITGPIASAFNSFSDIASLSLKAMQAGDFSLAAKIAGGGLDTATLNTVKALVNSGDVKLASDIVNGNALLVETDLNIADSLTITSPNRATSLTGKQLEEVKSFLESKGLTLRRIVISSGDENLKVFASKAIDAMETGSSGPVENLRDFFATNYPESPAGPAVTDQQAYQIYKDYQDNKVPLGDICQYGSMTCLEKSLAGSVALDQEGITNSVLSLPASQDAIQAAKAAGKPIPGGHAVIDYIDPITKLDMVWDPRNNLIISATDAEEFYASYGFDVSKISTLKLRGRVIKLGVK